MSQPTTEVKNPSSINELQAAPAIETNSVGTPSMGHEENLPNDVAIEKAIEDDELKTDTISPAENTLGVEIIPSLSGEGTLPLEPHEEVTAAGVEVITPEANIQPLHEAAQAVGGAISGDKTPTDGLGTVQGEFNPEKTYDPTDTRVFPPLLDTGIYATGQGKPIHDLFRRKLAELGRKILGGKVDHQPESPNPLVPKTT